MKRLIFFFALFSLGGVVPAAFAITAQEAYDMETLAHGACSTSVPPAQYDSCMFAIHLEEILPLAQATENGAYLVYQALPNQENYENWSIHLEGLGVAIDNTYKYQ